MFHAEQVREYAAEQQAAAEYGQCDRRAEDNQLRL
jgi:hypothetical protein